MSQDTERAKLSRYFEKLLDDPLGKEIVGQRLGLELHEHKDLKDKPIVAVLVPSYKSLHPNMLDARTRMLMYSKQFCTVFSEPIRGSSIVHWVRNDMLAPLFKEKRHFTHVLWIDDDMVFEKDVLVKMLQHDKDVVGANYVTRSDPPRPNVHLVSLTKSEARRVLDWKQDGIKHKGSMICAEHKEDTLAAGTGLMLIKREVLEAVGQMYIDAAYEKLVYGLNEEQIAKLKVARQQGCDETGNYWWFDFLPRLSGAGQMGEDTSFCVKAAMCGFTVWVDTAIQPGHMGEYAYSYRDFVPVDGLKG